MNNRIDLTQFEGNEQGWMYDVEGIGAHPKNYFEKVETKFKDGGVKTMPLYLDDQEVNAITLLPELITELKRCYEELDRPKVTIDDWDKAGPCVTVYLEGKEYVGILREYDASE